MKCRRLQDLVSWSDLPEHLLQLVLIRLRIGDYIIFRCVCATWRAAARCLHSPLLLHPSPPDEGTPIFFCPLDYRYYRLNLPGLNNDYEYLGCFHGWLLVNPMDPRMRYTIFFFNPFTAARINLPAYDTMQFYSVKLSSAPTDPKCIVIITTGAGSGFKFCRIGDNEWTEVEFDSPLQDAALLFRDKLYLLFCRSPSNRDSTIITSNIAKYFKLEFLELKYPLSFKFRSHNLFLVESLGDILLVVKRSSLSVTSVSFFVFRLDLSTLSWVETKNIGNQVLFLENNCSASFTATELGCKENQIYFIVFWKAAGWGVFDIEDGSSSMTSYQRSSTLLSRILPKQSSSGYEESSSGYEESSSGYEERPMWITPCFV